MGQEIHLNNATLFEEKVYVIAEEVLNILKELSKENKNQINSKMLAEKMFWKKSVKDVFNNYDKNHDNNKTYDVNHLKELTNTVLEKFSELIPSSMSKNLCKLKDQLHNKTNLKDSKVWIDSSIKIIKKYIDSLSNRNKELEEFMKQTMLYLADTEKHLSSELSSQKRKFNEDRELEKNISTNMNMIKNDFNSTSDINNIRTAVLSKIENINKGIEKKREQDVLRLKETEKTLEKMTKKMNDIKHEADVIRKRAQEIEFESIRDNLTGLYNRKAYEDKIVETLANLKRYNVLSSLIVCDIDHFKKINDNFGHKVGDLALQKLASLLKERLRINDFISRYGGEEFAVILPHTDLNNALKAAESLRDFIDKSVFSYNGQKIPLTISIGISSFRKDDNCDTVFERADKALYLAKDSGRNTVKTENDVSGEEIILN